MKLANRDLWRWAWKTYLNIFFLKRLWQGVNTSSFGHNIGESELSGAGRNTIYVNIFYLKCLWEAPKHQVLQIKLENLAFQECSWIIYLDIFYLKCLRKVSKHRVLQIKLQNLGFQERAWIIYFEYLLFEIKTPSFANKNREFKLSEADRKNIIEYLLFKKPLGRHQNTQLCTWNWRIWAFRGGQE